jgi:hypothetical protein
MKYTKFKFKHKETIVTVLAENDNQYNKAVSAILQARRRIEEMIKRDPYFLTTYEPYDGKGNSEIVEKMIHASRIANVGPMACVAGAIAGYAVRAMLSEGNFAVVDNGGDIVIHSSEELSFGIYTPNDLSLGFKINPEGFYSICTSSGTVGHSVSFGFADAVTIFSKDPEIADCFATRIGNEIKEEFSKKEIRDVLKKFWDSSKEYIDGILIIKGDIIGKIGNVPKLIRMKVDYDLITKG